MLLYDADCGFCTRCARWLDAHAPGLEVRPMHTVDLARLGVDEARATREVPFVLADGSVAWGAAAIGESLRRCRAPWSSAGRVLLAPPVLAVARPVYALVARNRHRLPGGTAACALPPR